MYLLYFTLLLTVPTPPTPLSVARPAPRPPPLKRGKIPPPDQAVTGDRETEPKGHRLSVVAVVNEATLRVTALLPSVTTVGAEGTS